MSLRRVPVVSSVKSLIPSGTRSHLFASILIAVEEKCKNVEKINIVQTTIIKIIGRD